MKCPRCGFVITKKRAASAMGKSKSEAKQNAARENGKLGGRPRKTSEEPTKEEPIMTPQEVIRGAYKFARKVQGKEKWKHDVK